MCMLQGMCGCVTPALGSAKTSPTPGAKKYIELHIHEILIWLKYCMWHISCVQMVAEVAIEAFTFSEHGSSNWEEK